jgi:hypothetical protein
MQHLNTLRWEDLLLEYSLTRSPNDIRQFRWDRVKTVFETEAQILTSQMHAWCINYLKQDYQALDFDHTELMGIIDDEAKLRCGMLNIYHPYRKFLAGQPVERTLNASLKVENNGHCLETTYTVNFSGWNSPSQANRQQWKYGIHIGASVWTTNPFNSASDNFWTEFIVDEATFFPGSLDESLATAWPSTIARDLTTTDTSICTQETL